MITVRKADDRGRGNHGWLESRHTFSFAEYRDPEHMGFRTLRVINEDRVAPGSGFPTHPHRDMEIITLVLEGSLEHRDSMGNGSVIRPGELQRMSAGSGVTHSECNASQTEPVHFYQIWILPDAQGIEPSYEQRAFDPQEMRNRLRPVASRAGDGGALTVHQDVTILLGHLTPGEQINHGLASGRHAWLQVLDGDIILNGMLAPHGDKE